MVKLVRDTSTPERATFWAHVKATAAIVRERPDWQHAGVVVNPERFEDYKGEA